MVRVIARLQSMAPRIPANPELLFNTFPACRCHREFNKFTCLVYLGCCDDALLNSLMNPSGSYWAKGMLGWNAAEQNFHGAALGAPLRQPRERPLQVQPWTELIYSGFWNFTVHFTSSSTKPPAGAMLLHFASVCVSVLCDQCVFICGTRSILVPSPRNAQKGNRFSHGVSF